MKSTKTVLDSFFSLLSRIKMKKTKTFIIVILTILFSQVFFKVLADDPPPSKFDLRYDLAYDCTTPVKDQGDVLSCTIFATLASLESFLKKTTQKEWDLSEKHVNKVVSEAMVYWGTNLRVTNYLTSWLGPVKEEDCDYDDGFYSSCSNPNPEIQFHVQEILYFDRENSIDNIKIKEHLQQYGAIAVILKFSKDNVFRDGDYECYYYNDPNDPIGYPQHSVAIVGWDDSVPKEKFKYTNENGTSFTPPGDGAFIIKNSHGLNKTWDHNGYFYTSYYTTPLMDFLGFRKVDNITNYQKIFHHDIRGIRYTDSVNLTDKTTCGYDNKKTMWASNIFTADENITVKAVSLVLTENNTSYDIYINAGVASSEPRSGYEEVQKLGGSRELAGYYTVKLNDYIDVQQGKLFSVIIKFSHNSSDSLIPYESIGTANQGESFMSEDGVNWEPILIDGSYKNACIKAFADKTGELASGDITIHRPNSTLEWRIDSFHEIHYSIDPEDGLDENSTLKLELINDNPNLTSGVIKAHIDLEANSSNNYSGNWGWTLNTVEGTHIVPGAGYKIRLTSNQKPLIWGESGEFKILEKGIPMYTPTANEELVWGEQYRFYWEYPIYSVDEDEEIIGNLQFVLLQNGEYYKGFGIVRYVISHDGSFGWTINNLINGQSIEPGTGFQIRLTSEKDTNYVGLSQVFSIVSSVLSPSLTMTSPNGGETLTIGENYTFTWSSTVFPESENIGLKIIKNDIDLGYIAADIPNTGSYDMVLSTLIDGQAIEPGNDYKIEARVMDTSNGIFADRSDQNFTILADESICTETWQPANSPITYWINDLIFVNDGFMAVAGGRIILTSVDGIDWNSIDTGVAGNNLAITYGNNQYVVTGTDGLILTSPDGTTWTQQTSGVLVKLRDVIWANSLYIAVGFEGTILTSPDGITWTVQTSGTTNILYNVAYGNNTYVVVGEAGLVLVSPDGITWWEANSGISSNLFQVAYLNGQFFALGKTGIILTSPDGINWTSHTSGTTEKLYGIGYEFSRYVVTGNAGTILTSPDGTTWTARDSGVSVNLFGGIASGNGKFVVAGDGGTILYSECPTQTISVMSPNGGEDLAAGSTYTVTWNASNINENIKINLYKGNQWYGNIVRDIPAVQGYYNWSVGSLSNGETAPEGTDYKILVRVIENGPYDRSDGNFTISQ